MNMRLARALKLKFAALVHKAPLMIGCDDFEDLLDDYVDGRLSKPAALRFDLHLMVCKECRIYLEGYRNAIDVAQTLADVPFETLGMGDVSDEFMDKIIAQQMAGVDKD